MRLETRPVAGFSWQAGLRILRGVAAVAMLGNPRPVGSARSGRTRAP